MFGSLYYYCYHWWISRSDTDRQEYEASVTCWRSSGVELPICNRRVGGSNPSVSSILGDNMKDIGDPMKNDTFEGIFEGTTIAPGATTTSQGPSATAVIPLAIRADILSGGFGE